MPKGRSIKLTIALVMVCVFSGAVERQTFAATTPQTAKIIREVRHELATLPYYGVFDWLEYVVQPDNTVVAAGSGGPTYHKVRRRKSCEGY